MLGQDPAPVRCVVDQAFASGGMCSVHFGRIFGPAGFSRVVAVKRLHPPYSRSEEFAAALLDEARLLARVRHPNVVPPLEVLLEGGELHLVMEYVHGAALAELLAESRRRREPVPEAVAAAIGAGLLEGLHAAHEATSERGLPLGIIHRDVSPHNVLVGSDGVTRVIDFGVARAVGRLQDTRPGAVKGKPAYMPPEQLLCQEADRRADLYAAGVVLWEMLAGRRLFEADTDGALMQQVLEGQLSPPSAHRPGLDPRIDALILRALARAPSERWSSGRELAMALEQLTPPASPRVVGEWVERLAGPVLGQRARMIAELEGAPPPALPRPAAPPATRTPGAEDTRPEGAPLASGPAPRRRAAVAGALAAAALGLAGWLALRPVGPIPAPAALEPTRPAPEEKRAALAPAAAEDHPTAEPERALPVHADTTPRPPAPRPARERSPARERGAGPAQQPAAAPSPVSAASPTEPPAPPAADCAVPYVVGKGGIRRLRPECL